MKIFYACAFTKVGEPIKTVVKVLILFEGKNKIVIGKTMAMDWQLYQTSRKFN
jgi:hypothetical protein